MDIFQKYMDETIRAIGAIIKLRYNSVISVKKIRKLYEIGSYNHSKINFYWRSLQVLEKNRILERYGSSSPKKYRILNFYEFFNLLYDAYIDQVRIPQNPTI